MADKKEKILVKRKKFLEVDIPITRQKIELIAETPKELEGKTVKLDLTRQLKGKSVELVLKINNTNNKLVAEPIKINLLSYFIKRMIRKRISYVEDSFFVKSQDSELSIKPFLITKRKVSRQIRKTLRNKTKNWLEDYIAERKDIEIFNEILSNKLQKTLSLYLKKTYPLSMCEIRILEIKRKLNPEEVPKIKPKEKKAEVRQVEEQEEFIDQMKEIEEEKIKKAEEKIKETQELAEKIQEANSDDSDSKEEPSEKKLKKPRKKKEEKAE